MSRADLRVVGKPVPLLSPEGMLAAYVPELIEAERRVRYMRQQVADQGRLLAKERGVAFIREEKLRQEFGS